jgi:hypothetical protein
VGRWCGEPLALRTDLALVTLSVPTAKEVGDALARFGNYRVLRTQQLAEPTFFHPSVLMALGLRETGLRNICGGAKLENGKWVQAFTDRGCFQISEQVSDERAWLSATPGCPNGQWEPAPGETGPALRVMHVPRFTYAAIFVLGGAEVNRAQAIKADVNMADLLRFCVAAHNAGFTGALNGYRNGNVDENTAHGDYSATVMATAPLIHTWVQEHPAWIYKGQVLGTHVESGTPF